MTTEYAPLDIASHLDNGEVIAEYLTAAAEDDDPNVLLLALAEVAKARGMAHVAEAAGLGRESLYKALAPGAHPRFETIQRVLRALDVRLVLRPPTTGETLHPPANAPAKMPSRAAASSSKTAEPAKRAAAKTKKSITADYIICLEDGRKFKSLKRHLRTQYNLSPEEYREKWDLPSDYPMVAPAYAKVRSALAKQMGLAQQRRRRK